MALGLVYAVTFVTLEMYLAAIGLIGTGVMWLLIAAYRSPNGVSIRPRRSREVAVEGRHRSFGGADD